MRLNPSAKDIPVAEVVVLATKPQMLDTAAPAVQAFIHPRTLLISILAGKTLGDLAARLPNASAIIRAMPNPVSYTHLDVYKRQPRRRRARSGRPRSAGR